MDGAPAVSLVCGRASSDISTATARQLNHTNPEAALFNITDALQAAGTHAGVSIFEMHLTPQFTCACICTTTPWHASWYVSLGHKVQVASTQVLAHHQPVNGSFQCNRRYYSVFPAGILRLPAKGASCSLLNSPLGTSTVGLCAAASVSSICAGDSQWQCAVLPASLNPYRYGCKSE